MEIINKKRYWLRGGVSLSVTIGIIYSLAVLYQNYYIPTTDNYALTIILVIAIPLLATMYLFTGIFNISNNDTLFIDSFLKNHKFAGFIMELLIVILFYFMVGALVGWLYGLYKNRKN